MLYRLFHSKKDLYPLENKYKCSPFPLEYFSIIVTIILLEAISHNYMLITLKPLTLGEIKTFKTDGFSRTFSVQEPLVQYS